MANNSKAGKVLVGALVAGAISYLRKPENREKAMSMFNDAKGKVTDMTNKGNVSDKVDKVKESVQGLTSDVSSLKDEVKDEVKTEVAEKAEEASSEISTNSDTIKDEELDPEGGIQKK